jgi:hypothetical protein
LAFGGIKIKNLKKRRRLDPIVFWWATANDMRI